MIVKSIPSQIHSRPVQRHGPARPRFSDSAGGLCTIVQKSPQIEAGEPRFGAVHLGFRTFPNWSFSSGSVCLVRTLESCARPRGCPLESAQAGLKQSARRLPTLPTCPTGNWPATGDSRSPRRWPAGGHAAASAVCVTTPARGFKSNLIRRRCLCHQRDPI